MVGPTSKVNPAPVMRLILPPTCGSFSYSATSYPACRNRTPAPTTITRFMQLLSRKPICYPVMVWVAARTCCRARHRRASRFACVRHPLTDRPLRQPPIRPTGRRSLWFLAEIASCSSLHAEQPPGYRSEEDTDQGKRRAANSKDVWSPVRPPPQDEKAPSQGSHPMTNKPRFLPEHRPLRARRSERGSAPPCILRPARRPA